MAAPPIPNYRDATVAAGLTHIYSGSEAYVVGGGAAAFDCGGDARPELALAGGEAGLTLWRAGAGGEYRLEQVKPGEDTSDVTGVYPLDLDSDGVLDLFVLRFGRNQLLRGLGECRFEDATARFGLPKAADWTTAFAATWEAGETLPTLFIGNYVPRDRPLERTGNCEASYLLRPDGEGYGAPIPLGQGACTLSALFVDWSGGGQRDLRLANDREYYDRGLSEQLWRLNEDGAVPFGRDQGWDDIRIWGMGLAATDLNGDARPEIAVTNMADNRIEQLRGDPAKPSFDNIARPMNAMAQRPYTGDDLRPSTAWHVDFADFNNDGWRDLWIVKGNVDEMPKFAAFDPDSLLLRDGQRFVEAGDRAGIAVGTRGRGGAAVDLNGDGALDLVTVNREQPATLFLAEAPLGQWIAIDPRQPGVNRFAVDATVEIRAAGRIQRATRRVGGGHAGGALTPIHFGLGDAAAVEARVIWPDGAVSNWAALTPGETHIVERTAP